MIPIDIQYNLCEPRTIVKQKTLFDYASNSTVLLHSQTFYSNTSTYPGVYLDYTKILLFKLFYINQEYVSLNIETVCVHFIQIAVNKKSLVLRYSTVRDIVFSYNHLFS